MTKINVVLWRVYAVTLAVGAVLGLSGCGGGEEEPVAVVSPATRQYQGTWAGISNEAQNGASQVRHASVRMTFTLGATGHITGGTYNDGLPEKLRASAMDAETIGNNNFAGVLEFADHRTDISGTLSIESENLVGTYRYYYYYAFSETNGSFVLDKTTFD